MYSNATIFQSTVCEYGIRNNAAKHIICNSNNDNFEGTVEKRSLQSTTVEIIANNTATTKG